MNSFNTICNICIVKINANIVRSDIKITLPTFKKLDLVQYSDKYQQIPDYASISQR